MTKLDEIRIKINEIDKNMAKLFEERMYYSKEVAKYKNEHNLPVFDSIREEENIKQNVNYIVDKDIKNYYIEFLTSTMNISKEYQTFLLDLMNSLNNKNIL